MNVVETFLLVEDAIGSDHRSRLLSRVPAVRRARGQTRLSVNLRLACGGKLTTVLEPDRTGEARD